MSLRVQLARLKRRLLKRPYLKDPQYPPYWFDLILKDQEAFIVQIGSNDGKTGDPLNALLNKNVQWKALFVEPIPHFFNLLQKNYPNSGRFTCENVAINKGEKLDFYWVDPKAKNQLPDLPFWFEQLGSFNKEHIVSQLDDKIKPFILSKELEGLTLSSLFNRNKVDQIDILHIDTEGYDWEILSQLDLIKFQPSFILYEMNHLSKSDLEKSIQFLKENYMLFKIGIDMLAVHRKINIESLELMKLKIKGRIN